MVQGIMNIVLPCMGLEFLL